MSRLFDEISGYIHKLEHPVSMETIDNIWARSSREVYWNADDSIDDLGELGGDTYSGEICGRPTTQDDCVFFNLDNGCGETYTHIFRKDKEVKFDE